MGPVDLDHGSTVRLEREAGEQTVNLNRAHDGVRGTGLCAASAPHPLEDTEPVWTSLDSISSSVKWE